MKKPAEVPTQATPEVPKTTDNALAIISVVLGVVSLTGPGLILGIPAIITGAIALKKKQGERGLSITGIVTGIVSTVFSLVFIAALVFLVIWGINNPEEMQDGRQGTPIHQQERFESLRS